MQPERGNVEEATREGQHRRGNEREATWKRQQEIGNVEDVTKETQHERGNVEGAMWKRQ